MTALEAARRNVVGRMSGCPQPDCYACRANRDAASELVRVALEEAINIANLYDLGDMVDDASARHQTAVARGIKAKLQHLIDKEPRA